MYRTTSRWALALLITAGCSAAGERTADEESTYEPVASMSDAATVSVAELDIAAPESVSLADLESADFVVAPKSNAADIAAILEDSSSYMTESNGCFDQRVAVKFEAPDTTPLYAVIGLECWNVTFLAADETAELPDSRYLEPGKLHELADEFQAVIPELHRYDLDG